MTDSPGDQYVTDYQQQGFAIARQVIDPDLARETAEHVLWLLEKNPGVRAEHLHHHMMKADPFMWRLAGDPRILDLVSRFIGDDIALFAAHYVAKPPKTGQKVLWHQDGSYWPLDPMEVITIWLAADDSTPENGCMRVLPGTHEKELMTLEQLMAYDEGENVLGSGIDPRTLDESDAVDLILAAGDVSIHNPRIVHGSEPNTSSRWRRGLTLRYIPTSTRVLNKDHGPMLLRGNAHPGVENHYAPRPVFDASVHMPFNGCESWK